ncbi:MAG: C39 family peptidase [Terriglobia bacterium]
MQRAIPRHAVVALYLGLASMSVAAPAPAVWLDVPYVKQPKEGCGAACIVMVLQYWVAKDAGFECRVPGVESVQRALYSPKVHGIYALDMGSYLRQKGMRVFAFRGGWGALEENLTKGRPLIVCLREGGSLAKTLHYVIVVGVDPARNLILVNDPAGKKLEMMHRASFEKKWRGENYWTLLAVPRS